MLHSSSSNELQISSGEAQNSTHVRATICPAASREPQPRWKCGNLVYGCNFPVFPSPLNPVVILQQDHTLMKTPQSYQTQVYPSRSPPTPANAPLNATLNASSQDPKRQSSLQKQHITLKLLHPTSPPQPSPPPSPPPSPSSPPASPYPPACY